MLHTAPAACGANSAARRGPAGSCDACIWPVACVTYSTTSDFFLLPADITIYRLVPPCHLPLHRLRRRLGHAFLRLNWSHGRTEFCAFTPTAPTYLPSVVRWFRHTRCCLRAHLVRYPARTLRALSTHAYHFPLRGFIPHCLRTPHTALTYPRTAPHPHFPGSRLPTTSPPFISRMDVVQTPTAYRHQMDLRGRTFKQL